MRRLKDLVRDTLARRGYEIRKVPSSLLQHPERRLSPALEFVVAHYLLRHPDLFFVQIGAYDGVAGDPLQALIRQHRLRGILVEPQFDACQRLRDVYSDQPQVRIENAAISDRDGERLFYTVDTSGSNLPAWTAQLASFQRDVILNHRHFIPDIENRLRESSVPCVTLGTLLRSAGANRLDLLQIDAEGYDAEIIRAIDFSQIKPAILHYEHKHLSARDRNDVLNLLLDQGYHITPEYEDTLAYKME